MIMIITEPDGDARLVRRILLFTHTTHVQQYANTNIILYTRARAQHLIAIHPNARARLPLLRFIERSHCNLYTVVINITHNIRVSCSFDITYSYNYDPFGSRIVHFREDYNAKYI